MSASEAVTFAVSLLEDEFNQREAASKKFSPEISSSHLRSCIGRYEDEMLAASERLICCCCGSFVAKDDIYMIDNQDDLILQQKISLDRCGHHESSWTFCRYCYTAVSSWKIPKFSAVNFVNITMCQDYPSVLEDLTAVEECLIAKSCIIDFLLAISALFFRRGPSAGTHGVFVFVSSGTKCWNPRRYCLCFHIGCTVSSIYWVLDAQYIGCWMPNGHILSLESREHLSLLEIV